IDSIRAFRFRLATIERFPGTLYLAPEPAAPFVALTESVARAFPQHPPYRGQFASIVPHLTVAHGSEAERDAAEAQLRASLSASGAVLAACSDIVLIEDSSGRWREMHAFALVPGGCEND
ncbi:MAG TPA: 2'-5' RNA ligase family protein, partial [Planctomycetota bacterium]|nr:2'-5' RNA ligase family protein [Planctomycetota bacterium]